MPSDDEEDTDDHHQFLTPSSEFNAAPTSHHGIVHSHTIMDISHPGDNSLLADDLSSAVQPPADTPPLATYLDLSASNSEVSLAQPLLAGQHGTLPTYPSHIHHEDERISSSASSTTSSSLSANDSLITNCRSYMTLYFTDMLISAFIITPLVNIHWRGAWDLLDIHLLPDYPITSGCISFGIGLVILYFMYLTQGYLQRFYEQHRRNLLGQIMTRVYTLLIALAYLNQWRGLWTLLDLTSNTWYYLMAETLASVVVLLLLKSIYNLNSAPFLIAIDTESYFLLDSKHKVAVSLASSKECDLQWR